ncbi:MAG: non-canonical purine pyrophosphatase, rdgB/HAM1 family [Candidatus Kaiserbacteria bacterium]|nr:non-canonical purine pyrophosphatase, rdgB/HAM1 family [Candidatus Kaiserbacteria bacterium]
MEVILSTRNPTKIKQIQAVFADSSIKILSLDEVGISGEAIEDGTTLGENAFKKARYAYDNSDKSRWCMADDTGIFIASLNNEPGIYAARWAGEGASTEDTMAYALKRLEGQQDRSATFKTFVAVVSPEGVEYSFEGAVEGTMRESANVSPQPKMPYSPLFVPNGYTQSWSEMTTEEENKISHRGQAFRKVRSFLESI